MDTVRVNICYRPLRIAWAIRAGDLEAFRKAARLSYALWGGRFNPIVIVDHEDEASRLIDLFHVDWIRPIGDSDLVREFPKRFPHLIPPLFPDELFVSGMHKEKHAQLLDVHNALAHVRDTSEWKTTKEAEMQICTWQADDPLRDVFLAQFGAYPDPNEIGIDYREMLMDAAEAKELAIDSAVPIPIETLKRPTIAYMCRYGLQRHYSVQSFGWDYPGFFLGDSRNCDDLVCHWNLRAADVPVWFIDRNHMSRYVNLIPEWEKHARAMVSHRAHEFDRQIAVWLRSEDPQGTQLSL